MQNTSITSQNVRSFLRALHGFTEAQCPKTALGHWQKHLLSEGRWEFGTYVRQVKKLQSEHQAALVSSLSQGQIESKLWLYGVLKDVLPPGGYSLHVAGGWTGLCALLGLWLHPELFSTCHSFDLDPECEKISRFLNEPYSWNGQFHSSTLNVHDFSYAPQHPTILVNTICEHLADFQSWYQSIPTGQFLVLQNNNLLGAQGHVNCVQSLAEFEAQAPLQTTLFAGELELFDYTRFMLIGVK